MAVNTYATILSLESVIKPPNITDTIEFNIPYFNNIRVLDIEYIETRLKSPMYGDEMDISLWKKLKLIFGTRTGNYPIYTLVTGWKYIYNNTKAEFNIYDNAGAIVYSANNIKTITDFHVDFTVVKSHQFEVHFDIKDLVQYFIPAISAVKKYGESPIVPILSNGINSNYGYAESSSYSFSNRIVDNNISSYVTSEIHNRRFYKLTLSSVNYFNGVNWSLQIPCSHVYEDKFILRNMKHKPQKFKFIKLHYNILFSVLLMSLIPSMQPIQRPSENHNNRPVYEPWLIWGFFKFLWLHRYIDNEDELLIDVWDLSPNWSY